MGSIGHRTPGVRPVGVISLEWRLYGEPHRLQMLIIVTASLVNRRMLSVPRRHLCRIAPLSLHHQYGTVRELHNAMLLAANHSFAQTSMTPRPYYKQIHVEIVQIEINNIKQVGWDHDTQSHIMYHNTFASRTSRSAFFLLPSGGSSCGTAVSSISSLIENATARRGKGTAILIFSPARPPKIAAFRTGAGHRTEPCD